MPGWVYVMTLEDSPDECRIGHHATTNKQREREVKGTTHEDWKIVHSVELRSKLASAAVEALAHALLEGHEGWKSYETRSDLQIFRCSREDAIAAVEKAAQIVRKNLS